MNLPPPLRSTYASRVGPGRLFSAIGNIVSCLRWLPTTPGSSAADLLSQVVTVLHPDLV